MQHNNINADIPQEGSHGQSISVRGHTVAIMSSARAAIISDARTLGFTVVGRDGRNHIRLEHENGAGYSLAGTASDWRTYLNARRDLEHIAQAKLPRAKSGRHPHLRQPRSDFRKSAAEQSAGATVAELVDEAEELRARFTELVVDGSRGAVADARQLVLAYEAIRRRLARLFRIIPAIDAVTL